MALMEIKSTCYHCGEDCGENPIQVQEKTFCCDGCSMVYSILEQNDMCRYYSINQNPGVNQRQKVRENKFLFLDDDKVQKALISYQDESQTFITFYLPHIHCSSCLWLLENLHKIEPAVISSKVDFPRKEVEIFFDHKQLSVRKLAELLTSIGYEPYINLNQFLPGKVQKVDRSRLYKLGVAGFCFANIMLFSFPEYLGIDVQEEYLLKIFRIFNVILAMPVFFYSASEFYQSAWKGLKHGFLNIDAPIVLAIIVTFVRSLYEVFTGTGAGFFDSMSGIVLFMLAGRVLQERTYNQLNFERDYTSYFPVAVTRVKKDYEEVITLPDIKLDDTLLIHSEELIPADGLITRGHALIDYSFVTGESEPVRKDVGELVYAGGKQVGGNIEVLVIKEVSQSYLTRLWNRDEFTKQKEDEERSFVHLLSRYFTWILFTIAASAATYWYFTDASKIWDAVTAILIVACPCALLLSNTFTNGNILRRLGRHKLYLRSAQVIEDIANANCIVFDKTGTLTSSRNQEVEFYGKELSKEARQKIVSLASQSNHPLSRAIVRWAKVRPEKQVNAFNEVKGKGLEGVVDNDLICIGSRQFVCQDGVPDEKETSVYVSIEEVVMGRFILKNKYRDKVPGLLRQLRKGYKLAVLSGDNEGEKQYFRKLLGHDVTLLFNQSPEDKLQYIRRLQNTGNKVIMIGDGLNDAGALKQAEVGIAVSDDANCFTPASDAILDAERLSSLAGMIKLCKTNKRIVMAAFVISILYNIVGITISVQALMSPMIAAILMPASSLSILLITFGASNLAARTLKRKGMEIPQDYHA